MGRSYRGNKTLLQFSHQILGDHDKNVWKIPVQVKNIAEQQQALLGGGGRGLYLAGAVAAKLSGRIEVVSRTLSRTKDPQKESSSSLAAVDRIGRLTPSLSLQSSAITIPADNPSYPSEVCS